MGSPTLKFADGRQFHRRRTRRLAGVWRQVVRGCSKKGGRDRASRPAGPIEICLLGNVQVEGAPESFRYRRRLTELVAFLAMHPEGSTSDSFATAVMARAKSPGSDPRQPALGDKEGARPSERRAPPAPQGGQEASNRRRPDRLEVIQGARRT